MDDQQPIEKLRSELARRGLPRAYIERLASELADHYSDLLEERSTSMGAARKLQPVAEDVVTGDVEQRLGDPTQLAIFAAEQYQSRTWLGRHPWFTFAILPLPLLVVSMIAFSVGLFSIGQAINWACLNVLGMEPRNPRDFLMLQGIAMGLTAWYFVVVPPLASGLLLCRVYRRNALPWCWPVAGCAIIALAMAFVSLSFQVASEQNNGLFTIGLHASTSARWIVLTFLPRLALALGVGLLLVRRAQQQMALQEV